MTVVLVKIVVVAAAVVGVGVVVVVVVLITRHLMSSGLFCYHSRSLLPYG